MTVRPVSASSAVSERLRSLCHSISLLALTETEVSVPFKSSSKVFFNFPHRVLRFTFNLQKLWFTIHSNHSQFVAHTWVLHFYIALVFQRRRPSACSNHSQKSFLNHPKKLFHLSSPQGDPLTTVLQRLNVEMCALLTLQEGLRWISAIRVKQSRFQAKTAKTCDAKPNVRNSCTSCEIDYCLVSIPFFMFQQQKKGKI